MPVIINLAISGGYAIPVVLEYQRVLNDHLVLSISPGIAHIQETSGSVLMMELWVRLNWHPFQKWLQGFYIGPGFALFYLQNPAGSRASDSMTGEFLGVTIGYQIVLDASISVDLGLGLAFGTVQGFYPAATPALPRAALAIGYRF